MYSTQGNEIDPQAIDALVMNYAEWRFAGASNQEISDDLGLESVAELKILLKKIKVKCID